MNSKLAGNHSLGSANDAARHIGCSKSAPPSLTSERHSLIWRGAANDCQAPGTATQVMQACFDLAQNLLQ
jgi:hypothetical protein